MSKVPHAAETRRLSELDARKRARIDIGQSGEHARGAAQLQTDARSLLRGRVTDIDSTTGRVATKVYRHLLGPDFHRLR